MLRTPGYPAFILLAGERPRIVLTAQILMGAAIAPLLIVLALRSGLSWGPACATGFVWAGHPALVVADNMLLTEALFNGLGVAGIWLASSRHAAAPWAGGLTIGAASLVRPVGLIWLVWAVPFASARISRRAATVVFAVAMVFPVAWAARNYSTGNGFRVSVVTDQNLLVPMTAYVLAEARGEDWSARWQAYARELGAELESRVAPGEDVYRAARALALSHFAGQPGAVARVQGKSWLKLAVDHSLTDASRLVGAPLPPSGLFSARILREPAQVSPSTWVRLALAGPWMLLNAALALLAAAGLVLAVLRRDVLLLPAGLMILLFAVSVGGLGLERFRLPMLPGMLLLAGSVLHATIARLQAPAPRAEEPAALA